MLKGRGAGRRGAGLATLLLLPTLAACAVVPSATPTLPVEAHPSSPATPSSTPRATAPRPSRPAARPTGSASGTLPSTPASTPRTPSASAAAVTPTRPPLPKAPPASVRPARPTPARPATPSAAARPAPASARPAAPTPSVTPAQPVPVSPLPQFPAAPPVSTPPAPAPTPTHAPPATPVPAPATFPPAGSPVDCARVRCIALTFDDGPSAYTPALLAILAKHHVHATFFELGAWAAMHPATVRQVAAAGHAIGTHSWDHPDFATLTDQQILDQVRRSSAELTSLTGQPVTMLRPPYGSMKRPMPTTGKAIILWDADTHDYVNWKVPRPDKTIRAALAQAKPGAILLIHDSHGPSVRAVEPIIVELQRRGYTFVTVPQLIGRPLVADTVYEAGEAPR